MNVNSVRTRLVIYTVLTGSKEPLGNPVKLLPPNAGSDLDIHFVCFTDNRELTSQVWEFRYLDDIPLPSDKVSRRPKAMPHIYLPEWDYSLYVDNIVVLKRLPQRDDLHTDNPYVFKLFRHQTRCDPGEEAEAIVQVGYEKAERLTGQLDFYSRLMPVSSITPLSTCTVILRQHHHPDIRAFAQVWWEQILNFSKRDQMSFDFALKWSRTQIEFLPGQKSDNDLIYNPVNYYPGRILANFDPTRYSWLHRDDPSAILDPRQHYLNVGQYTGRDYSCRSEILEFICYRCGSSLGSMVMPRRAVAPIMQELIKSRRGIPRGRMLIVSVHGEGELSFSREEADKACNVIAAYMCAAGFSETSFYGARLSLSAQQVADGSIVLESDARGYDIVFILGVPGELLTNIYAMLVPILTTANGLLFVLTVSSTTIADIACVELALGQLRGSCQVGVHSSEHDALNAPLRNSVLSFEWLGPQRDA